MANRSTNEISQYGNVIGDIIWWNMSHGRHVGGHHRHHGVTVAHDTFYAGQAPLPGRRLSSHVRSSTENTFTGETAKRIDNIGESHPGEGGGLFNSGDEALGTVTLRVTASFPSRNTLVGGIEWGGHEGESIGSYA